MMHCDIKSLNFLVGRDLCVKLADLGEARKSYCIPVTEVKDLPVNIFWSSPEIIHGAKPVSQKADVWSLASVLFEIFSGNIPFDSPEYRGMSFPEFHQRLEAGLRPEIPRNLADCCPWICSMLANAWSCDPQDRPSAVELAQLINTNFESLCNMEI
jgi:serine/threonine protein kinase